MMDDFSLIPIGKDGKNGFAKVDSADYARLNRWRWRIHSCGYAVRTDKYKKCVYMHRVVAKTPKGMDTDHINRDKLDNRSSNLRKCPHADNVLNREFKPSKSGYRGVHWNEDMHAWYARIQRFGKQYYLGRFSTPEEASVAYSRAAVRLFKEFA